MKVCFGNSVSYVPALDQAAGYSSGNISMPENTPDSYAGTSSGVELGNVMSGESPQSDAKFKETFKNLGYNFEHSSKQYAGKVSITHIGLDKKIPNKKAHIKELNSEDIISMYMDRGASKPARVFAPSIQKALLPMFIPSLKELFDMFLKQDVTLPEPEDLIIDKITIKNGGQIGGKHLKFKELDAVGHISIIDTENMANRIFSKGTVIIDSSKENVDNKRTNLVVDAGADKYLAGYFIATKATAGTSLSLNYKASVKEAKAGKVLSLADSAFVNKAECPDRIYLGDSTVINQAKTNRIFLEDQATAENIVITENNGKPGEVIINTANPNESIKGTIDFQGKKGTIYINQGQKLDASKIKDPQNVEIKELTKDEMGKKFKDFDSDDEVTFTLGLGTPSTRRIEKYNAYMRSIGCKYV